MENIKKFFKSEGLKNFNKKVFNKKTLRIGLIALVIIVGLKVGYSALFQVNGVVKKVDGTNVTVSNFFATQTINAGDYPITGIQVGDRIEISKNISGDILSIRDESFGRGHGGRQLINGSNPTDGGNHQNGQMTGKQGGGKLKEKR